MLSNSEIIQDMLKGLKRAIEERKKEHRQIFDEIRLQKDNVDEFIDFSRAKKVLRMKRRQTLDSAHLTRKMENELSAAPPSKMSKAVSQNPHLNAVHKRRNSMMPTMELRNKISVESGNSLDMKAAIGLQ
mmetsp:Transcript_19918/g.24621  ORF Transcript_19918/g.24621 Transcript_19918/m.24621 type:complete len:130 (+) Transcript_19918:927-1316(+)